LLPTRVMSIADGTPIKPSSGMVTLGFSPRVISRILPVINTAIAHKDAGVGMIGAGIVHPPFACFEKAILGWCERYGV
ncbi:hypothetical protein CKT73_002674, partial [Escherichia coli]|nr:hypothetical protein [Escherichia coli]